MLQLYNRKAGDKSSEEEEVEQQQAAGRSRGGARGRGRGAQGRGGAKGRGRGGAGASTAKGNGGASTAKGGSKKRGRGADTADAEASRTLLQMNTQGAPLATRQSSRSAKPSAAVAAAAGNEDGSDIEGIDQDGAGSEQQQQFQPTFAQYASYA